MAKWSRNLPNEHGGWVLLGVGIVLGIIANPGPWQAIAVLGWFGMFVLRVPLTRIFDRHGGFVEVVVAGVAGATALGAFMLLAQYRPMSVWWVAPATLPGLILVLMHKRKFIRSIIGETLSAFGMSPLLPSIAAAGGDELSLLALNGMYVAMTFYLIGSVLRVRAVARFGRQRATMTLRMAGLWGLPLITVLAWMAGLWPALLVYGALPAIVIGAGLYWRAHAGAIPLMAVGLWETASVIPFAVTLITIYGR